MSKQPREQEMVCAYVPGGGSHTFVYVGVGRPPTCCDDLEHRRERQRQQAARYQERVKAGEVGGPKRATAAPATGPVAAAIAELPDIVAELPAETGAPALLAGVRRAAGAMRDVWNAPTRAHTALLELAAIAVLLASRIRLPDKPPQEDKAA